MNMIVEAFGRIKKRIQKNIYGKFAKNVEDLTFDDIVRYLYTPTDPASLGVTRMLFGIMMIVDGPEERGGAEVDFRWGDPRGCHFPLIPLKVLPLPYMALLYGVMWLGAIGIALGYKYRKSAFMFAIPYWYIFLLDKSFWNNHSYLFGLIAILMIGTQANNYLSLDAFHDKSKNGKYVPYWNYFILKYQFFILYFVAGLKKSDREWLSGYAMTNLTSHWVFDPFKIFFSVDQLDYFLVHWFAFIFDLTVCFWMMYEYTRPVAMIFCAMFHLMNSKLFRIGMFPWVCLATMPLFCAPDWPRVVNKSFQSAMHKLKLYRRHIDEKKSQTIEKIGYEDEKNATPNETNENKVDFEKKDIDFKNDPDDIGYEKKDRKSYNERAVNKKERTVTCALIIYMAIQAFLPYSHFITKGYNNWTNGLYGYSWDMMVNNWDTVLVMVKVVDNESKKEMFLDPDAWTQNDRWSKHGDMTYQYARCVRDNIFQDIDEANKKNADSENEMSKNISIYIDVWCSMNARFQQRMFNPDMDLLKVQWSPFKDVEWLMPMLSELSHWRQTMTDIQNHVYTWNNYSDVLFVADFPGMYLENYINQDLSNVTLTVLDGQVYYELVNKKRHKQAKSLEKSIAFHLTKGETVQVPSKVFHKIHTVGDKPACYMYTFMNSTMKKMDDDPKRMHKMDYAQVKTEPRLWEEFIYKINNFLTFLQHVGNALLYVVYGVPMMRRIEVR